jgi:hypothetical protein
VHMHITGKKTFVELQNDILEGAVISNEFL